MFLNFESSNENIILLNVARYRSQLFRVTQYLAIYAYIGTHAKLALISERQHVQQSRLARSTRSHNRHHLTRLRHTTHLKCNSLFIQATFRYFLLHLCLIYRFE